MIIEAVTVCIDFADKLQNVISNKNKLNRWLIVTHESDVDTIALCKKYSLEYICSKRVFDNAPFAKGRAINDGLVHLNKTDWLLHIDADQLLPDNFIDVIQTECLDKTFLYGCKRTNKKGDILDQGQFTQKFVVNPRKIKSIKKRVILPIGYFQLWHSSIIKVYDEKSLTGDKDDLTFMNQWLSSNKTKLLSFKTIDVSGDQGHYSKHFIGIRNLKQNNA